MTTRKKIASVARKTPLETGPLEHYLGPEPASPAKMQIRIFDEAVQLFGQRQFAAARARFEESMLGPASHVTDKARTYSQVCARKMSANELSPMTAEDCFNYGVERLNARDVEQARLQFSKALSLQPDADYILYTMALACGLCGDGDGAYENLRRAIQLEPRNRILARQDPEFSALAQRIPLLRTLLQAESSSPF